MWEGSVTLQVVVVLWDWVHRLGCTCTRRRSNIGGAHDWEEEEGREGWPSSSVKLVYNSLQRDRLCLHLMTVFRFSYNNT